MNNQTRRFFQRLLAKQELRAMDLMERQHRRKPLVKLEPAPDTQKPPRSK